MFGMFRRRNEPVLTSSGATPADTVTYVRLASLITRYPRRVELAPTDKALLREMWSNPPTWTIVLPAGETPFHSATPPQRPQPRIGVMPASAAGTDPVTGGPAW